LQELEQKLPDSPLDGAGGLRWVFPSLPFGLDHLVKTTAPIRLELQRSTDVPKDVA
jgi:hypothetical protein